MWVLANLKNLLLSDSVLSPSEKEARVAFLNSRLRKVQETVIDAVTQESNDNRWLEDALEIMPTTDLRSIGITKFGEISIFIGVEYWLKLGKYRLAEEVLKNEFTNVQSIIDCVKDHIGYHIGRLKW
jgi:hypothetical protein